MAKIEVKGVIVPNEDKWIYDFFEMDAVCPRDVLTKIPQDEKEPIDVYINSGGGEITSGSEIYAALREYRGIVNIHVVGMAASAASVIACAGKSDITPTALFMYHNVSGGAHGDYHELEKGADRLKNANRSIAAAYMEKTGMSENELLAQMDAETWITAADAVRLGFIDEIAKNQNQNARLTASTGSGLLPQETINKIRNQFANSRPDKDADFLYAKAELDLIKLGSVTE